ncbi:PREDICTED: HVA22-like protein k, partial [Tarenaya hassleriana]|uniref:HVA22-like protein k n=1 Tax=Tarenaya hassleriana TaxID=28532 RepID=UPI0008FCE32E
SLRSQFRDPFFLPSVQKIPGTALLCARVTKFVNLVLTFASQISSMAFLGSGFASEVGLRVILSPIGSNIVLRTACCSIGIGIPVYSTIKAIEKKDPDEQQKWLIYWAAYGTFSLAEVFADKLISWFPLYYHVKFAFLVWLQLPTFEGAKQIYNHHLRPFFLKHQARVDKLVDATYDEMVKIVTAHQGEIRFAKAVYIRMIESLRGSSSSHPNEPQGQISNQSSAPQTATNSDSESEHED